MSNHPPAHAQPTHPNRQSLWVAIALILGIVAGEVINLTLSGSGSASVLSTVVSGFNTASDIFLRLIKMIIAPLVFSTLVGGMAKMGDIDRLGRIGLKALLWFFSASLVSLLLGIVLVNVFEPGTSLQLNLPISGSVSTVVSTPPTLASFVGHVFPKSIIEAMANNEVLQIVVFSIFFGVACASLGDLAVPVANMLDSLGHIMLKMTSYVMVFAPIAVFSAMASVVSQQGVSILWTYGKFIGEFYLGLLLLCCLLGGFAFIFLRRRLWVLLRHIREPMLLAFGTASSESAYPRLLVQLERFGCDEKVCSLVLPLGYSFNLDGSMMYMTFAVLFIAQAYGIDIPLADQLLMLLVLLLTSKGIAGVPRASLVVISATLSMFKIPEAGLLLLLGIDSLLDMGRSATNVFGNSMASALVCRWEKVLR